MWNRSMIGLSLVLMLTLEVMVGCGGGGGPLAPPGDPGRGALRVTVNFQQVSRSIPEIDGIWVGVMGSGLAEPLEAHLEPEQPSTSFGEVPVGEKVILVAAMGEPQGAVGDVRALNAAVVQVQQGQTTTATVNLSLTQSLGILETVFNGTAEVNGVLTHVLQRSDGGREFYSLDKHSPSADPPNVLLHGVLRPGQSQPDTWNPAILFVPAELRLGQPLTQQVTQTFADGSSEPQTVTVTFEGFEGIPDPINNHFDRVAKFRLRVQGTTTNYTRLIWMEDGFGRVLELQLDAHGNLTDFMAQVFGRADQHRQSAQGADFFPLWDGLGAYYLVGRAIGTQVDITVGLPFGIVGRGASDTPENAVVVRFSKPVDVSDASNVANYELLVNGQPVSLSAAIMPPGSHREVLLQGPQLNQGDSFTLTARNIKDATGAPLPEDGVHNTLEGTVGPDYYPPFITAVSATSTQVVVDFSEPMDPESTTNPAAYQFFPAPLPGWPHQSRQQQGTITLDPSGKRGTLTLRYDLVLEGAEFVLEVGGPHWWATPADAKGNKMASITIGGPIVDTAPPGLTGAAATTDQLVLRWREKINPNDARDSDNYQVESPRGNPVDLSGATIAYDEEAQTVTLTGIQLSHNFKVRAENIRDLADNRLDFQVMEGDVSTGAQGDWMTCAADPTRIWVMYTRDDMLPESASNRLNYRIELDGAVLDTSRARFFFDEQSDTLVIKGLNLPVGSDLRITVKNMRYGSAWYSDYIPEDGVANVCTCKVGAARLGISSARAFSTTATMEITYDQNANADDADDQGNFAVVGEWIYGIGYDPDTRTTTLTVYMNVGQAFLVIMRSVRNEAGIVTPLDFAEGVTELGLPGP